MPRIVFAGTPDFALPALAALAASGHSIAGVLTQPDRPAGRGRALRASPVKRRALELGIPIAQPRRLDSAAELATHITEFSLGGMMRIAAGRGEKKRHAR